MATRPLPNEPLDSQQVYSATYSNVPVYEFITPNGSVMRRKSDGWVNATHILKVANFPKAKRTRILEKDVQTGVHEKVQGGYGKYQGTWVPLERGLEIANEFSVDIILDPIFSFTKEEGSLSPPPAPKHHNASSKAAKTLSFNIGQRVTKLGGALNKSASTNTTSANVTAKKMASFPMSKVSKLDSISKLAAKKRGRPPKSLQIALQEQRDYSPPPQLPPIVNNLTKQERTIPTNNFYLSDSQQYSPDKLDDHHLIHQPSSSPSDFMSDSDLVAALRSPEQSFQSKKNSQVLRYNDQYQGYEQNYNDYNIDMNSIKNEQENEEIDDEDQEDHPSWYYAYRNSLLDYFHTPDDGISEVPAPEFLLHPPPGFDINHGVDKENNTALHWACAVGDLKITETLLQRGANANALNNDGLIPIMRSVLFTNPYKRRTFAKLLDLLRESLFSTSLEGRTILHLIAISTNSKIRLNAARYYMEMLLGKIAAYHPPETVVNYVNKQDHDGNTALHLVSRNSVKKYLKILITYGARIDISNKMGIRVEDYLQNELIPSGSTSSTFQDTHHFQLSQIPTQQHSAGINPYYQNLNNQHLTSASLTTSVPRIMPVPHFSELAIQANQLVSNQMIEGLDDLANAYDTELQVKEEEINEVKSMLVSLNSEINEITTNLERQDEIQKMKDIKEKEYDLRKFNLKKSLERSQSKDLATLVQISEQELAGHSDEEDDNNVVNDPLHSIIWLTLYQYRRRQLVDNLLSTIASNQNYQIDKYKHLMKLCLKGSLEDIAGGDTDQDDVVGDEDAEVNEELALESNGNGPREVPRLKRQKRVKFDDEDLDEDLLLDILINNLDPF